MMLDKMLNPWMGMGGGNPGDLLGKINPLTGLMGGNVPGDEEAGDADEQSAEKEDEAINKWGKEEGDDEGWTPEIGKKFGQAHGYDEDKNDKGKGYAEDRWKPEFGGGYSAERGDKAQGWAQDRQGKAVDGTETSQGEWNSKANNMISEGKKATGGAPKLKKPGSEWGSWKDKINKGGLV